MCPKTFRWHWIWWLYWPLKEITDHDEKHFGRYWVALSMPVDMSYECVCFIRLTQLFWAKRQRRHAKWIKCISFSVSLPPFHLLTCMKLSCNCTMRKECIFLSVIVQSQKRHAHNYISFPSIFPSLYFSIQETVCFIITLIYLHSLSFLYFKHSLRPHNLWWTIPHQVEMLSRSLHGFGCTCYRNPQWSVTRSVIREPDRDKINEKNVLETFSKISLRQLG